MRRCSILAMMMLTVSISMPVRSAGLLDSACLNTSVDSLLTILQTDSAAQILPDSIDTLLGLLSVKGTCDSVTVLLQTTVFGQSVQIPFMRVKTLSSCSLKVTMVLQQSDTVYDLCALTPVVHPVIMQASSDNILQLSAVSHQGQLMISYNIPVSQTATMSIVDIRGRAVRAFPNLMGQGAIPWNGMDESGAPLPRGTYACIAQTGMQSSAILVNAGQ